MTYADLADHLGMAESSIKRIFAKGDMPLSRIDEICRVLKLDFADLARRAAVPVYALGGIDGAKARALIGSGACGLAGVSAIQAAFGPD